MSGRRVDYITAVVRFAALVASAAILVVATSPDTVSASCAGTFPRVTEPLTSATAISDAVARAETVFRGRIIRREHAQSSYYQTTAFAVETMWKGQPASEIAVQTSICRNPDALFLFDGTYVVYVGRFGSDIGAMNHSKRIVGPVEEDAVLGPGTAPTAPTSSTRTAIPGTVPPRRANLDATVLLVAAGIACVGAFTFLLARQQLADNRRARAAADR